MTTSKSGPQITGMEGDEGVSAVDRPWLVTFADLFCLLLAFFVLLFSMSQLEVGKWKNVSRSLSKPFESRFGWSSHHDTDKMPKGGLASNEGLDLGYLGAVLRAQGKNNPLLQKSVIYLVGERLVVSLPGDMLFAPGSTTLDSRETTALGELGGIFRNVANDVEVVGHTDPTPVTAGFPSNWDLSLARAESVAEGLRRGGYPRNVAAYGVADAHFSELPESVPLPRRLELARRVDIVLTPNKGAD
jgi:chemotaxis protein MotB